MHAIVICWQTWWDGRDLFACDQHAFNDLHSKLMTASPKARQKVAILPPHALNSEYPVYISFDPTRAAVLHLFGEKNCVRYRVFQQAARYMCSNTSTKGPGVSLSRETLATTAVDCYMQDIITSRMRITRRARIAVPDEVADGIVDTSDDADLAADEISTLRGLFDALDAETSGLCGVGRGIVTALPGQKGLCAQLYMDNAQLTSAVFEPMGLRGLELDLKSRSLYSAHILMEESTQAVDVGMQVNGRIQ